MLRRPPSTAPADSQPLIAPRAGAAEPLDYALNRQGITWGNEVVLLPGGSEAFPVMLEAIAGARESVLLESYIFHGDSTGRAFLEALGAAARRGCRVYLLCDGLGSMSLPASLLAALERDGGHCLVYRPVSPWRPRWGVWHRDHRKALIIDNGIGFVGGLNIGDEYDDRIDDGRSWRDLHLVVKGPAAAQLARLFLRTWNAESPTDRRVRIAPPMTGGEAGQNAAAPAKVAALAKAAAVAAEGPGEPAAATRSGAVAIIGNREWRHRSLIRRSFLYAVRQARSAVYLANPYFIPDGQVMRALRSAAHRGVDVRVIVPQRSDVLVCDLAARATFGRLLRSGVRIAEWRDGMMHAKAVSVDGAWATVGSYNFDRRSLVYNLEVTANVFDRAVAGPLEAQLRADFDASDELDGRSFAMRPLIQRLLEHIAYRFRAWL